MHNWNVRECCRELLTGLAVMILFSAAWAAAAGEKVESADPNGSSPHGPVVCIDFESQTRPMNPTSSFMYFVPLISPVPVRTISSDNNSQVSYLLDCERSVDGNRFHVICEFRMAGNGSYLNFFDPASVMDRARQERPEGKALNNILESIRFEGEGFGKLDIRGHQDEGTSIIDKVEVHFEGRGHRSPVTVSLYSVKPVDGKYLYENRHNQIVARVRELSFQRTESTPYMDIEVVSVRSAGEEEGFWASLKGAIANIFIDPFSITKVGNQAMLDFGHALYRGKSRFVFPKATNLVSESVAEHTESSKTGDAG